MGELSSLSLQHLPQSLALAQPSFQPVICGAATWVPQATGASHHVAWEQYAPSAEAQRGPLPVELHLQRGWGRQQQPPCMHDAAGLTMVSKPTECILQGHDSPWSGSMQHQGVMGTTFMTSANMVGQAWCSFGEGGHSDSPRALPVATAPSLVTTRVGAKCRGDSSQMLKKLSDRRLWHMV